MAPYTGQNIGAGKKERVSDGVKKASICGFVWSAICIPIVLLFGKPMTLLFLSEPNAEVVNYSFLFLLVSTLGYCLLTLVGTVRFSIQGMGYSGFAMTAGVLEMAARTIAGVVLAPLMGYMGICCQMCWRGFLRMHFCCRRSDFVLKSSGAGIKTETKNICDDTKKCIKACNDVKNRMI